MSEFLQGRPEIADFEEFRGKFNEHLTVYGDGFINKTIGLGPDFHDLATDTIESIMHAGKRLRPYLTYLGYSAGGEANSEVAYGLGMALELYHSALLVHDDIMDRDLVRHGTPNVMGKYRQRLSETDETRRDQLSMSMGLLSGDLLFGLSIDEVLKLPVPDTIKTTLLAHMTQLNTFECAGQQLDALLQTRDPLQVSVDELQAMYVNKTARYSYVTPLEFGAIVGGLSQETRDGLTEYGLALGVAFQVVDDVLGVFGNEVTLGKPVTSDLEEGKKTILMSHALALTNADERAFLLDLLNDGVVSDTHFERTKQILESCGALQATLDMASELGEKARASIQPLEIDTSVKEQLEFLIDKSINRTF